MTNRSSSTDMGHVVIVESPYAGDIDGNRKYAVDACADCFSRGEIPFASHLLYPQVLNELKPQDRELGIQGGYKFWPLAKRVVFYTDRGWSPGMLRAKQRAISLGYPFEERSLNQ